MSRGRTSPAAQAPTRTRQQQSGRWQQLSCMLQMLPRLSVRELPGMPLSDAAVQQLAAMQGLRQVSLSQLEHMPACDVQRLPNSITQLHFSSFRGNGPSLPSQLQQLTRPLQLHLQDCAFLPTMLGSVTQLQTLCVDTCRLLPGGSQGTAALLDVLPKLSCLQDLELRCLDRNMTALYDVSQEAFSALTASSHLTRLVVDAQETPPLPYLALAYMFKDQQRTHLAKLEELQISTVQQQPSPSAEPVPVLLACMHVCLCLLLLAGCCQGVSGASRQLLQCSCVLSVK